MKPILNVDYAGDRNVNLLVSELNWELRAQTLSIAKMIVSPVTASSIQIKVGHYDLLRRFSQFPLTDEKGEKMSSR